MSASNYRGLSVMQCLPKCYSIALNDLLTCDANIIPVRAPT